MRLPESFAREWVAGLHQGGWRVRIGNKGLFVPRRCVSTPGEVRERLEAALGIVTKPARTAEEVIVGKSRTTAGVRRAFRNRLAAGKDITLPWNRPRTLSVIIAEERTLAIALKWQRMGEFKR